MKGGSRKNPYQQAKVNHVNLKQGLSDGMILSERVLRNVPALIVFNQPIKCNNQLSGRVKSWLHITDNDHFLQKLADITEPHTDLSNVEIINLVDKLNLLDEWKDLDYCDQVMSDKSQVDVEGLSADLFRLMFPLQLFQNLYPENRLLRPPITYIISTRVRFVFHQTA